MEKSKTIPTQSEVVEFYDYGQIKHVPEDFFTFRNDRVRRHHHSQSQVINQRGITVLGQKINSHYIENLVQAIELSSNISLLKFESCQFESDAYPGLVKFFTKKNNIEFLGLNDVSFDTPGDWSQLMKVLETNKKLKQIDFSRTIFSKEIDARCFDDFFSTNKIVQFVDFTDCKFVNLKILDAILRNIPTQGTVKVLVMRQLVIEKLQCVLYKYLIHETSKSHLKLFDISKSGYYMVRSNNDKSDQQNDHLEFFTKFKSNHRMETFMMEDLIMDINPVIKEFADSLKDNKKLQNLSLRGNRLTPESHELFWLHIHGNQTLRTLNFEKCKLTDKCTTNLSNYLSSPGIGLEYLNLQKNQLTYAGLKHISKGLKMNSSLKALHLSNNTFEDAAGLTELTEALKVNKTLLELKLSRCKISDNGLYMLSRFLEKNDTLKILDISRNEFNDPGLKDLCNYLGKNTCLQNLYMQYNGPFTEEGGLKDLFQCIESNRFLKKINLQGNKLEKPFQQKFVLGALKKNINIQEILGGRLEANLKSELESNIAIERDIVQRLELFKETQQLWLNLAEKSINLLKPAMKLIKLQNLQNIDLSRMQIENTNIQVIANYLLENPPLQSLRLAGNHFDDDGMIEICDSLVVNQNLIHLQLLSCENIGNKSMNHLYKVLYGQNKTLYKITIDFHNLDQNIYQKIAHEARLNKSIKKYLQPFYINGSKEVGFEVNANLKEHFEAVVKCWRLMKPQFIDLCDKNLDDEQIIMLTYYLENQEAVKQVLLRRNNVTDIGAEKIAVFIKTNKMKFKHIELSRNKIQDKGGQAILQALKQNTRLQTLLIAFGNEINAHIIKKIEDEVLANNNINKYVKHCLDKNNPNLYQKLKINDKGPDLLRCSLKSTEMCKILYLDLSDNLLNDRHAKMIAKSLEQKSTLKELYLSKNLINASGAEYLGNSLGKNQSLEIFDISQNNICDRGIQSLILPIAKAKISEQLTGITSSKNKVGLQKIDISHNNHTTESLKHVYALLFANRVIVVIIDDPRETAKILEQENKKLLDTKTKNNDNEPVSPTKLFSQNGSQLKGKFSGLKNKKQRKEVALKEFENLQLGRLMNSLDITLKNEFTKFQSKINSVNSSPHRYKQGSRNQSQFGESQAQGLNGSDFTNQVQLGLMGLNEEIKNVDEFQNNQLIGDEENNIEQPKVVKKSIFQKVRYFCFGKKTQDSRGKFFIRQFIDDMRANKKDATTFKCNENILTKVESVSQKYVTAAIYLSIFFFYITSLTIATTEDCQCETGHPFISYLIYLIYIIMSFITEFSLCLHLQKKVGDYEVLRINKFHLLKLFTGQLARLDFFTDVLFIVQLKVCGNFGMMITSIIFLALSQGYTIFMIFKLMSKDHSNLLENIERNCKLAYISEHQSLAIILDSFSLCNFQSVNKKTVTIPKIVSSFKSFSEDLPQFIIQVVYLLAYTNEKSQTGTIYLSILLGASSFGISLQHALTAKSSNVDSIKVLSKIKSRNDENDLSDSLYSQEDEEENEEDKNQREQKLEEQRKLTLSGNLGKKRFSIRPIMNSSTIVARKSFRVSRKNTFQNPENSEINSVIETSRDHFVNRSEIQPFKQDSVMQVEQNSIELTQSARITSDQSNQNTLINLSSRNRNIVQLNPIQVDNGPKTVRDKLL